MQASTMRMGGPAPNTPRFLNNNNKRNPQQHFRRPRDGRQNDLCNEWVSRFNNEKLCISRYIIMRKWGKLESQSAFPRVRGGPIAQMLYLYISRSGRALIWCLYGIAFQINLTRSIPRFPHEGGKKGTKENWVQVFLAVSRSAFKRRYSASAQLQWGGITPRLIN